MSQTFVFTKNFTHKKPICTNEDLFLKDFSFSYFYGRSHIFHSFLFLDYHISFSSCNEITLKRNDKIIYIGNEYDECKKLIRRTK